MCMYSIQAHDGAVAALTCSASYIISIGTDERLCVWERFQGHLLHALPAQRAAYSFQLVMLTQQLLITSNQVIMQTDYSRFIEFHIIQSFVFHRVPWSSGM